MKDSPKYACTYFDKNFLYRGKALINSFLKNSSENDIIYVLALDDETKSSLYKTKDQRVIIIELNDILPLGDNQKVYKTNRELYFSLTPTLCKYLILKKELSHVLYLDADVFIFSSLDCLYDEVNGCTIAACSHRRPYIIDLIGRNYGKFNVGINYFSNDSESIKCLTE